jgi:hypothetical protein
MAPSKTDLLVVYLTHLIVALEGKQFIRHDLAENPTRYFGIWRDVFISLVVHPVRCMVWSSIGVFVYLVFYWPPGWTKRWLIYVIWSASVAPFSAELLFTAFGNGLVQDIKFVERLFHPDAAWTAACNQQLNLRDPHILEKSQFCQDRYNITWDVAMEQTERFRRSVGFTKFLSQSCEGLYVFWLEIPNHVPVQGEFAEPVRFRVRTDMERRRARESLVHLRTHNMQMCYQKFGWVLSGMLDFNNSDGNDCCKVWRSLFCICKFLLTYYSGSTGLSNRLPFYGLWMTKNSMEKKPK